MSDCFGLGASQSLSHEVTDLANVRNGLITPASSCFCNKWDEQYAFPLAWFRVESDLPFFAVSERIVTGVGCSKDSSLLHWLNY